MKTNCRKLLQNKFIINCAVLFQCITALFFINSCRKQAPAPPEKAIEAKEQEPVEPVAKVVLRASLAGTWYSADPEALKQLHLDDFLVGRMKSELAEEMMEYKNRMPSPTSTFNPIL